MIDVAQVRARAWAAYTASWSPASSGLGDFDAGPHRLTSQLAAAIFSIPAQKGLEDSAWASKPRAVPAPRLHDPIIQSPETGFSRASTTRARLEEAT